LFSSILIAHKDNPHIPRVFAVIRPVVVGLIAGAGIGLGIQTLSAAADAGGFSAPLQILGIDLVAAVIFAVSALLLWRTDGHPVKVLIVGAVLGIILFSITGG
ncbi:MAG: chromate transporter, partial [Bacillota bacterium]